MKKYFTLLFILSIGAAASLFAKSDHVKIPRLFYGTYFVHNIHYNPDGTIAAEDDSFFYFKRFQGSGLRVFAPATDVFPNSDELLFYPSGRYVYHLEDNFGERREGHWRLKAKRHLVVRAEVSDGQTTKESITRATKNRIILDVKYSGGYRIHIILFKSGSRDRLNAASVKSRGHGAAMGQ